MKKQVLLFFLMLLPITAVQIHAEQVSKQEALQKAQQFMPGKLFKEAETTSAHARGSVERDAFYIFNAENNGGFVIVSGDDRTTEILGYSDSGKLELDKAPSNLKWLLSYYQHVIDSVGKYPNDSRKSMTRALSQDRQEITPLLTTQWGQNAPYNDLCPTINGQKCVTGCVATAMAQVINYYKWPQGLTSTIEAYTTNKESINMPQLEPTSFDWGNLTDSEIARLMLYCGQSVKMDYGLNESGADLQTPNAFESDIINIFGYSKSIKALNRDLLYYDDNIWESVLYDELSANRVILYWGISWSEPGHVWVVDGYKDGYFHMNWGWDGDLDGYYKLSGITLDELISVYDMNHVAYVGITPPANSGVISPKVYTTWMMYHCDVQIGSKGYVSRSSKSEPFPSFSVYQCTFGSDIACTQYIGIGLMDKKGTITCLSEEQHSFAENEEYYYDSWISLGSELENGEYRLVAICRNSVSDEWKLPIGSSCEYIELTVDDLMLTLHKIPDGTHSKNYKEVGVIDNDGVTYLLYSDYDNNCLATVLPKQVTEKYSGDLVVPSEIEYEGINYRVYYENNAFWKCDDLISLNTANTYINSISGCPKLTKLVLQEGVTCIQSICELSSLESIEIPATVSNVGGSGFISDCENLKAIRFKGTLLSFSQEPPQWDDSSLPSLTDIYFPMETPPIIRETYSWNPLTEEVPINTKATIHIPVGSLPLYKQSNWKNWKFVEDMPAASAVTWGYCHGDVVTGMGEGVTSSNNDVEFAIRVPVEELTPYKGCKITQIQVYSPERAPNDYQLEDYEYVFITKPGTDYIIKQPFNVVRGIWNTIELTNPYTITSEDDLYVGFGRHGEISVTYSDMTEIENATWGRAIGDDFNCIWEPGVWQKPQSNHPLPLRFTIEGESMPEGVVLRELELIENETPATARAATRTGELVKLQGVIRNRSLTPVTSYKLEWSIDGSDKQSKTIETYLIPNATEMIFFDLPATVMSDYHIIKTDVVSMNGLENELIGFNMPTFEFGKKVILRGDANSDGVVDEKDVKAIANHIVGETQGDFDEDAADLNNDDKVNAADIVELNNLLAPKD